MHSDHLQLARDQFDMIDDAAAAFGPDGSVARSTMDHLVDVGLYGLMVPEAVGGQELPLADLVDVYEELSRADGSTGWVHFACDLTAAYFGAYLPDAGVAEVFADGVPFMAGQFAPNGTAVPAGDDGAWSLTGAYQFGSGIAISDWAGGGMLATPEGADAPEFLFGCFPTSSVELRGNWDVLGLRATASYDYVVDELEVPATHTFDFFAPTVRRGGPMYRLGILPLAAAGHAGWALGVTRRMLDELKAAANTVRMGASSSLADSDHFLIEYAELESRYLAGKAWVRQVLTEAEAVAAKGSDDQPVDDATANLVRQACVQVNRGGAAIAEQAYLLAGTRALRDGVMQRCHRDLHAGSQHYFASHAASIDFARTTLAQG